MLRLLVLISMVLPSVALSWGGVGHEVVCEIAFQELNDSARRSVIDLVRRDTEYKTFAAACNWPDRPRQRDEEHYLNVSRSHRAITVDECPLAEVCVLSAIRNDTLVLADPSASAPQKLEALKFLGHWVGDVHQPMHVSYQDDRGANSVELQGALCEGSLHHAWDECIIRESLGSDSQAIAAALRADVTDADRASWQFDAPVEWANESYQLTIAADAEYCTMREGACWYDASNMMLQNGEARRAVTFDRQYVATHRATVETRLKQAGIRLGALLNRALQ